MTQANIAVAPSLTKTTQTTYSCSPGPSSWKFASAVAVAAPSTGPASRWRGPALPVALRMVPTRVASRPALGLSDCRVGRGRSYCRQ